MGCDQASPGTDRPGADAPACCLRIGSRRWDPIPPKGTVIALALGRFHRTDLTPNIVYIRRSVDNGESWLEPQPILSDPRNGTEFSGALLVDPDPSTGAVHFVYVAAAGRGDAGCIQRMITTTDEGFAGRPHSHLLDRLENRGAGHPVHTRLERGVIL